MTWPFRKSRRYIVVSGYHASPPAKWQPWFHRLWWDQNIIRGDIKHADQPERIFIFASKGSFCPPELRRGHWIWLAGNLGHCDPILYEGRDLFCPGCPATWMAGAWLAYLSECDMLYCEQDCLCFGPWLEQMYRDLGDKGMVFGTGGIHKGSSTSLFLVRHAFIPTWVQQYLAEGKEDTYERLPERKMYRLRQRQPENYAELSFGVDVDRPLPKDAKVLYAQKLTRGELVWLGFTSVPDVPLFSNHA